MYLFMLSNIFNIPLCFIVAFKICLVSFSLLRSPDTINGLNKTALIELFVTCMYNVFKMNRIHGSEKILYKGGNLYNDKLIRSQIFTLFCIAIQEYQIVNSLFKLDSVVLILGSPILATLFSNISTFLFEQGERDNARPIFISSLNCHVERLLPLVTLETTDPLELQVRALSTTCILCQLNKYHSLVYL